MGFQYGHYGDEEKGDGSQRGAVLMRGTETGRSARVLGSGWA
jgi:hypothetical protein